MNTNKIYERITDTIIELLENHKINDYSQSWFSLSGDVFAKNVVSNHTYNGINQLMLNYLKRKYKYAFNRWMTFKQLSELGGIIQKGSKASMVVYKSVLYLDKKTEKNITKLVEYLIKNNQSTDHLDFKKVGYLKSYNVFNVSQIDNLPDEFYETPELDNLSEFEKDSRAENIITQLDPKVVYSPSNDAYYQPGTDTIFLPERKQFVSKEAFYSILFHEVGHWTGHSSRLDRPQASKFGSKEYAMEELIAELNSAYILAYLGYENRITDNAAYIDNWLSVMKNDKKFVIQASSQAQRAADLILDKDKRVVEAA